MASSVYEAINSIGGTLTLLKNTSNRTYTPGTGLSSNSQVAYTVVGKITNYLDKFGDGLLPNNMRKALIPAKNLLVAPTLKDQIKDGSTTYNIMDINVVKDRNEVVSYICRIQA